MIEKKDKITITILLILTTISLTTMYIQYAYDLTGILGTIINLYGSATILHIIIILITIYYIYKTYKKTIAT